MKLRSQLLLVSLCILVLPWAGCQYIREMEQVLLDGQARELEATARAVSAHLQSQAQLLSPANNAAVDLDKQLYFHRLRYEPILDGYVEDWLLPTLNSQSFIASTGGKPRLSLFGGIYRDYAYLIFEIIDDHPRFHDMQQNGIANGDHLVLRIVDDNGNTNRFYLRNSSEGPFIARYLNPEGEIRQEHRLRGFWAKKPEGYLVEVLLPISLMGKNLDFAYYKNNNKQLGTLEEALQPPPWVQTVPSIEAVISIYSKQRAIRINVVNERGWLLAQSGAINDASFDNENPIDWQTGLYRLALSDNNQLDRLDNPLVRGRMDAPEITAALTNKIETRLYQSGNRRVARTAVPIFSNGTVVGAVAVEQSTDSLVEGTNTAFNRLFVYVGISLAIVFFILFTFASLLTFRIRRLSKAADNAIGDDGKLIPGFIHSSARDELGDLTRSYGQLFSRLHDYTDYLRTLASKLSHELRTPLAVVRSSLENLDHVGEREAIQYRQRAKEGAERLGNILSAMSGASHMADSIQNTPTETFVLDQLITELTDAYRSTYPGNKINLVIGDGIYTMNGSPDLIVQMLDKLIDNAVDFCPADGAISLELKRKKSNIQLSVNNTGPLLPEHMQGQLFDSLVSVRDNNDKGQKTHLGLGLYIVRLIVDFHRGQVHGRNLADNSGVSFDIQLPATKSK